MNNYRYNASVIELSKLLKGKKDFKLKLPGYTRFFGPYYDVTIFLEGELVIFDASQVSDEYFFVGEIKNTGLDRAGKLWFDVKCILRPPSRDPARKVNWLPKARITRESIICEIRAIK